MPYGMEQRLESKLEQRIDRVREHTAPEVNRRLDDMAEASIERTVAAGRDSIVRRLAQLDSEWDVDRALMMNFAIAGGISFLTGLRRYTTSPPFAPRRKGFLYFFTAQLGFLALHAAAGWCPPVVVFRRLGFRTKTEIETERAVLTEALGSA